MTKAEEDAVRELMMRFCHRCKDEGVPLVDYLHAVNELNDSGINKTEKTLASMEAWLERAYRLAKGG